MNFWRIKRELSLYLCHVAITSSRIRKGTMQTLVMREMPIRLEFA